MNNDENLSVTHDPGKWEILGLLTCLVICLAFAIPFAYEVVTDQGKPLAGEQPSEAVMLVTGFSLGALFFAGWTVREVLRRRKKKRVYRVEDGDIVCLDGNGQLWREPVPAYRQIFWHEETRSYLTKYGRRYYTVQALTLWHPQVDRRFEIFAHQVSAQVEACCELWARTLGLPVVRAEAGQPVERSADELAKPLVDLAAEGRLAGSFDVDAPPPAGATWGRDDHVLWVRVRPSLFLAAFMAPLLVFAGLATAMEGGQLDADDTPMLIVFLAIALALVLVTAVFRQVVRVGPSDVIGEYRCLGVTVWRKRLPTASIERVYRFDWLMSDGVIVDGRDHRFYLVMLNRKVALWAIGFLQNAILAKGPENPLPSG